MIRNRSSIVFKNDSFWNKFRSALMPELNLDRLSSPLLNRKKIWLRFRLNLIKPAFVFLAYISYYFSRVITQTILIANYYLSKTSVLFLFLNLNTSLFMACFFNSFFTLKLSHWKLLCNKSVPFTTLSYNKNASQLLLATKCIYNSNFFYNLLRTTKFLIWPSALYINSFQIIYYDYLKIRVSSTASLINKSSVSNRFSSVFKLQLSIPILHLIELYKVLSVLLIRLNIL